MQALVVVPTRELGIQVIGDCCSLPWNLLVHYILSDRVASVIALLQVTKVARILAAKACTVMALLDGGMLKRQKSWVKVTLSIFSWVYVYADA